MSDIPEAECVYVCVCVYQTLSGFSVVSVLSERRMHGADGCRAAHEPPVLRSHVCHRRREPNHHRPHSSAGEGARLFFSHYRGLKRMYST